MISTVKNWDGQHKVTIKSPPISPMSVLYAGLLNKSVWSASCSCGKSFESSSEVDVRAWDRYHSEANCD